MENGRVGGGGAYKDKVVPDMYGGDVPLAATGGGSVVATSPQPFHLFSPDINCTAFKSAGGMAAASAGPFTSAQWKELERQALIFKYMNASKPVPAHLLFPAPPNPSVCLTGTGGGDPDLRRCKRTDGKKWRCSRDVAPQHKYCERHLQKSRPRSRMHVEVKNNHKKIPLLFNTDSTTTTTSPINNTERLMEGGMINSGQQWKHLVDASVGFGDEGSIYNSIASVFRRDYVEQLPLNMLSYTDFRASEDVKHIGGDEGNTGFLFNPDLTFVGKKSQNEAPSGFIDAAWLNDNFNSITDASGSFESSLTSQQGKLSNCSLNLSMTMSEEMGNDSSRMLTPVGIPFAQGGPLAEALRSGSVGLNPASPYDSIITSTQTTVSSPSCVLHRTLLLLSDSSSVCNSPTTVATATPQVFAFRHLN